ncbi:MAG: hypothetical protein QXX12_03820 [Nanopusillaceae archaeon]
MITEDVFLEIKEGFTLIKSISISSDGVSRDVYVGDNVIKVCGDGFDVEVFNVENTVNVHLTWKTIEW